MRISLDAEAFKTLVTGGVVDTGEAKIILQDIGWDLMINTIQEAMTKPVTEIKYNFICHQCGTRYGSSEPTPPPSPNWADAHVCKPIPITNE